MAKATLKRPRYPMPKDMREILRGNNLEEAYKARPPYQRNDYIGWITRSKLPSTRKKRLDQMVGELKKGNVYMKMKWSARK